MLLPNIWGAGAIFAFSGLDGQTSYGNDFVATLLTEGGYKRCLLDQE